MVYNTEEVLFKLLTSNVGRQCGKRRMADKLRNRAIQAYLNNEQTFEFEIESNDIVEEENK